jgi:transposase
VLTLNEFLWYCGLVEITETQFQRIESSLPRQRGNVKVSNLQFLNALLFVAEQGCKWRGLPKRFGPWHTIYTRMNRWSKNGVLDQIFEQLQREQIVRIKIEAVKMDSTIGKSRGGWTTKIHMVAANARTAITFALSPGEASDAKAGRALLGGIGPLPAPLHLIMDKAYEDNETRQLALDFGFIPVVPPKSSRLEPWQYDQAMYRKRNEIERLFRRLKGFRRIFSRFEKLDVLFLGFLTFTLIVEALR